LFFFLLAIALYLHIIRKKTMEKEKAEKGPDQETLL